MALTKVDDNNWTEEKTYIVRHDKGMIAEEIMMIEEDIERAQNTLKEKKALLASLK